MATEQNWNVVLSGPHLGMLTQRNPRGSWSTRIKREIHIDKKTGQKWISFCGAHISVTGPHINEMPDWHKSYPLSEIEEGQNLGDGRPYYRGGKTLSTDHVKREVKARLEILKSYSASCQRWAAAQRRKR